MPGRKVRKILVSVKFVSAILGPETAAPILWTLEKMRPFCRKNPVHKIPRFGGGGVQFYGRLEKMRPFCRKKPVHKIPRLGGGIWGLGGGGKCRFYFYGRADFSDLGCRMMAALFGPHFVASAPPLKSVEFSFVNLPSLLVSVATPADPRGEKRNFFFVQILGGEKLLNFLLKSAGEIFLSGLRGAKYFSNAFRIVFGSFLRFSKCFSCRFKSFAGAVSFCRHAALTSCTLRNKCENSCAV